jgi:uncharacterized membrane protein YedE/YeeE
MDVDNSKEWHWFKGGLFVSLLSLGTYIVFQAIEHRSYPFGVTSGFAYISALFGSMFNDLSETTVVKNYLSKAYLEFFILVGLVIGGFTASKISGTREPESIPAVWKKYHGDNIYKRLFIVLVGGILLGVGAGIAAGCTTGNILQGWAHLSLGSIVAGASFFLTAVIAAHILFYKVWRTK